MAKLEELIEEILDLEAKVKSLELEVHKAKCAVSKAHVDLAAQVSEAARASWTLSPGNRDSFYVKLSSGAVCVIRQTDRGVKLEFPSNVSSSKGDES